MTDKVIRLDAADGPMRVRKLVVWRRLEPGDPRTPGTEISAESPFIEAKVLEVGISKSTFTELERLWKKKDEVFAVADGWATRYEPAGVLFTIGGTAGAGILLDFLPAETFWFSASLVALGVGVGAWTRARKASAARKIQRSWSETPEQKELLHFEKVLTPRWRRFSQRLLEESGFRTDVRVGDIHDADRLVSIDLSRLTHPDTWRPDRGPREVRYGWVFRNGRCVEQVAELEDTDAPVDEEE